MRKSLSLAVAALGAATLALTLTGPATAITGGEPDGEGHPNVALISFYEGGLRYRCSATLVNPTTLITAAHCAADTQGLTAVTFASVQAVAPPSGLPVASDPTAGYSANDIAATKGFVAGQSTPHPDYSDFTDLDNWNDVAIVRLLAPVTGIEPATIAPRDYLDSYTQPRLNKTLFELVGYGTEVRKPDSGKQKPTPQSYPLIRRVAYSPGQKLTPQIVQMNGNINDTRGTGGTCFGDSGGPSFLNGYLVTVTSYGYTDNCRYLGGYQRVDIPVVQDWLEEVGAL